ASERPTAAQASRTRRLPRSMSVQTAQHVFQSRDDIGRWAVEVAVDDAPPAGDQGIEVAERLFGLEVTERVAGAGHGGRRGDARCDEDEHAGVGPTLVILAGRVQVSRTDAVGGGQAQAAAD